jgi:hypothetical protein
MEWLVDRADDSVGDPKMTPLRFVRVFAALLACGWLVSGEVAVGGQPAAPLPLRLTASAANPKGIGDGKDLLAEISITRWTTAEERTKLLSRLGEGGSRALMLALVQVPSHGRIRVPGWQGPDPHKIAIGWDLRYAWHEPTAGGGHRIVLGTDRYISFWESRDDPRATDYPFTLLELRLDSQGDGVGKASAAARISFSKDKQAMELENYNAEPVLLKQIRIAK